MTDPAAVTPAVAPYPADPAPAVIERERPDAARATGSLTRRMIGIATLWIALLLLIGGFALDRVLSRSIVDNFDAQMTYVLNAMIAASEIGPDGEVRFNRPPADQRFLEPYSGLYFQVSGSGADTFPSRSLWDRRLRVDAHNDVRLHEYDSKEFADEPLRIAAAEQQHADPQCRDPDQPPGQRCQPAPFSPQNLWHDRLGRHALVQAPGSSRL